MYILLYGRFSTGKKLCASVLHRANFVQAAHAKNIQMIDFAKEYILENEVALLRPLRIEDCEHLLSFSIHEPEIWSYSLARADGRENLERYIHSAVRSRLEAHAYPFIVFDKRAGQYAGSSRFYDIQIQHQTLQLGFTWYGQAFQRTGLNRNCKYLLLSFAFETLDFKRVEFRADLQNERSIQSMKSIGCKEEGVLRSNSIKTDGKRRDSIVLIILQDEWQNGVKQSLEIKIRANGQKGA
jgi:N-acetyltransferase